MSTNFQFKQIFLCGDFDHLHKGDKIFLKKAFELGEKVFIGLLSDIILKSEFLSFSIEPFFLRKNNLLNFLKEKKWYNRAKIIEISDLIVFFDKIKNIDAVFFYKENYKNLLLKISNLQEKNGLKEIKIIPFDNILASDGRIISSERIRKGEINREGKNYWLEVSSYFGNKQKLLLPTFLKKELRKPLGKIFPNKKSLIKFIKQRKPQFIFSIGDIVSYQLIKNNIDPNLLVFDFKTKRKELNKEVIKIFKKFFLLNKIINHSGIITKEAFLKIKTCVEKILKKKENQSIFVEGEEDLLTLPVILFSPLNSFVFYGHWQFGIIGIEVDEKIKEMVIKLLRKFK